MPAPSTRRARLDEMPSELFEMVVRHLGWQSRYRLALSSKRMLQLVPALPVEAPSTWFGVVGSHTVEALAGWLQLVQQSRDGSLIPLLSLNVDFRAAVISDRLLGDLEDHAQEREVPLHVWEALPRLLRCVEAARLCIKGLGLPDGADPAPFVRVSRYICAGVNRFSSLKYLDLALPCLRTGAGELFHARLDSSFPCLASLSFAVADCGTGLGTAAVLTLGSMPKLRTLTFANLGQGGWVVPTETLPVLGSIVVVDSCPRVADLICFPAVSNLTLCARMRSGDTVYGEELRGCSPLASLAELRLVTVQGGHNGEFPLCSALQVELDFFEEEGVHVDVMLV